jgi:hypothetical protein
MELFLKHLNSITFLSRYKIPLTSRNLQSACPIRSVRSLDENRSSHFMIEHYNRVSHRRIEGVQNSSTFL